MKAEPLKGKTVRWRDFSKLGTSDDETHCYLEEDVAAAVAWLRNKLYYSKADNDEVDEAIDAAFEDVVFPLPLLDKDGQ